MAAHTHNVYVIELDPKVLEVKRFREANPDHRPDMACFYVGMTGLDPEERFRNHLDGYKSSSIVHRYGKYLRRKMFRKFNPMSYEEAVHKEVELAQELREQGYAVWQN